MSTSKEFREQRSFRNGAMLDEAPQGYFSHSASAEELSGRRILIYAMNFSPEVTGCGRYTGELAIALADNGAQVSVVTTPPHYPGWQVRYGYSARRYSSERRQDILIERCPIYLAKTMKGIARAVAPITWALSSAPIIIYRVARFRPTHLYCVEPTLFAAPIAILAARLVGAKTILHVQDLEIEAAFAVGHVKNAFIKRVATLFDSVVLKGFDQVVTISHKMREKLIAKGVKPAAAHVIRNWVNVSKIYPLLRPSIFRDELEIGETDFVVLYAGNIGAKQALHLLIDAATKLVGSKRIVFVIAGEGPDKKKLVDRNLPNVIFLPLQPETRLNELLNLADVHVIPQDKGVADLVLPSKLGGIVASGKPMIAMADQGTEIFDFLKNHAVLIPPGDADGLAASIDAVATQTSPSRPSSGQKAILEELSETLNISKFVEAFK